MDGLPCGTIQVSVNLSEFHKLALTYKVYHLIHFNEMIVLTFHLVLTLKSSGMAHTEPKLCRMAIYQHIDQSTLSNTAWSNNNQKPYGFLIQYVPVCGA